MQEQTLWEQYTAAPVPVRLVLSERDAVHLAGVAERIGYPLGNADLVRVTAPDASQQVAYRVRFKNMVDACLFLSESKGVHYLSMTCTACGLHGVEPATPGDSLHDLVHVMVNHQCSIPPLFVAVGRGATIDDATAQAAGEVVRRIGGAQVRTAHTTFEVVDNEWVAVLTVVYEL